MSESTPKPRVFRLPKTAYLLVVFLLVGSIPLAFADNSPQSLQDRTVSNGVAGINVTWRLLFLLVPIVAAIFVARTATVVTARGIVVRAAFGRRGLPWDSVRGLSVTNGAVYAVLDDGSVRLPCVRVPNLADLSRASGGRLPEIADPTPKYAPHRKRRR